MARIFRTMLHDSHAPQIGDGIDMLGVRVGTDVHPDATGRVTPGEGMSVAPAWHDLPPWRIPKRLKYKMPTKVPDPRGKNDRCIWRMGNGPFVDGILVEGLRLRVTDPTHGQVEPTDMMPVNELQKRLAATRDAWHPIDEDPDCPAGAQ